VSAGLSQTDAEALEAYRRLVPRIQADREQWRLIAERETRWAEQQTGEVARLRQELRDARARVAELEPYAPGDAL
jgi:hypothetical protein